MLLSTEPVKVSKHRHLAVGPSTGSGLRGLGFYMKLLPPMNWRSMDVAGISLSETGVK